MKKITLITLLTSLISMTSWGQCTANFTVQVDQSSGIATIVNNSSMNTYFNLGDGSGYNATQSETFYHTYTSNANYNVCASIVDSNSTPICSDTYCDSISITGLTNSCNVAANLTYTLGANGLVTFTNNSTGANYASASGDDNLSETYVGSTFTHTYTANGTYLVMLTAEDTLINNCQDIYTLQVVVNNVSTTANCQASYQWFQAYDSTGGAWINQVYLVATTSGNNLSYAWDFGDGSSSNLQYPTHSYSNVGSYGVCLTITTGDSSCTQTYCDTIEVYSKAAGFTLNVVEQGAATSITETVSTLSVENVYPNPTVGNTTLNINSTDYTLAIINVLDITGKIVMQQNNNLTVGNNLIELNTQELTNGMYIISIQSDNGNVSNLRLIKK